MDLLDRFAETLDATEAGLLAYVEDYMLWQAGNAVDFKPDVTDDVAIRTYLLTLRKRGLQLQEQETWIGSLRRFYTWAVELGFLTESPFESFRIERPWLTPEQIKRRADIFSGTPEEREISHLRALNQLAEQLNRTLDMQTTLTMALQTLLELMSLDTAWVFLFPSPGTRTHFKEELTLHDFEVAAALGLPPGLERNDRYHLCKPGDCHCQAMLRAGKMKRAVNVFECTRLMDSAKDEGDNQGLLFHASVPILTAGEPVGLINVATEEWQFLTAADLQLLSAIGSQVAIALERTRLYDLTERHRLRLERELQMARDVQVGLLPAQLVDIEGFSIAVEWRPAREMAGDFYDVFSLPDGRWAMVVADVSDKGAPAAMIMAMARSFIRDCAILTASPAGILREVNQRINTHSASGMFVTVFFAVLDVRTHALTYANAGHNPPLLRRTSGSFESLLPTGPLIGVYDELVISDVTRSLAPGDTLVVYTDGVTDVQNSLNEDYGLPRLTKSLAGSPVSDASSQLAHLMDDLSTFIGDVPPFDDITLLVLFNEHEN